MEAPKQMQTINPYYKQILVQDPSYSYTALKEHPNPLMNPNIDTSLEMPELVTQPFMENIFLLLKKMKTGLFKI